MKAFTEAAEDLAAADEVIGGRKVMKQYDVTGMSCAGMQCQSGKAVSEVPGVISCSVSLLTNSMGVEGTASASAIIDAVQKAGYGASEKGGTKTTSAQSGHDEELKYTETPKMLRRLIVSVIFGCL